MPVQDFLNDFVTPLSSSTPPPKLSTHFNMTPETIKGQGLYEILVSAHDVL
jgi:hypothetical protein